MVIYNETYCVYVHINKINGKKYVGQTMYGYKPEKRWINGNGYKNSPHFYNAINKYGWENFEHEIVASNLTKEEADNFERLLIKELDTTNPHKGYNIDSGGNNGKTLSEETKKKISDANKGRPSPNKGKKVSEETRKKIIEARKECWKNDDYRRNQIEKHQWQTGENHPFYGRTHSEETKKKISEAAKERFSDPANHPFYGKPIGIGEDNPFYGKHHSDETKQKISDANSGGNNGRARKIAQYNKQGVLIEVWDCIRDASVNLNVNYSSIGACCNGRQKTAGGFVWQYFTEEEIENVKSACI